MTQPKDIEGLRKVAEEATKGPWSDAIKTRENHWDEDGGLVLDSAGNWHIQTIDVEDARFIATFDPPTVLALLSELEAVKGENARLIGAVGEHVTVRGEYYARAVAAEAALVSLKGGGGSSCTNLDSSPSGATDSQRPSEGEP